MGKKKFKCESIQKQVNKIQIQGFEDVDVSVVNKSDLEMIGKGRQGAVFKVNHKMVVKVYGDIVDCEREYYAMSLGKKTQLLPKIFCKGENFIVMEMVGGVDLREYLQSQPLTKELSYELIKLLITFKKIGYERIDHHKRQIYLQEDGSLKVIDVGRTVWRNRTYPYPRKLLTSLGEYKNTFLEHVKELAPRLYTEWEYYMHLDEVSREMYHQLQNKSVDIDSISQKTGTLLTSTNAKSLYKGLVGLVRKTIKEERKLEQEKAIKSKIKGKMIGDTEQRAKDQKVKEKKSKK
ncbi:hypothetical protein GCM10008967_39510 [Bacillus carboniphilus]|uniref:Serine/threonine protein kinase n=1 Tax=Bacillus carboniphilus TaxID=86663 RepID=A0ABN0WRV5_9BACI